LNEFLPKMEIESIEVPQDNHSSKQYDLRTPEQDPEDEGYIPTKTTTDTSTLTTSVEDQKANDAPEIKIKEKN